MRHLWRVGRCVFQFDRARQFGGIEGSVNPARKDFPGRESCGLRVAI